MAGRYLMQQVLGDDWNRLAPVIRAHYAITPGSDAWIEVRGEMHIEFPRILTPMIKLIYWCGGLVDRAGREIRVSVLKSAQSGRDELFWRRNFVYPDGERRQFRSNMRLLRANELVEFINGFVGLRLSMSVENGDLIYRSNGHVLQIGSWCLVLPEWLVLGQATITEHALSDTHFELDFRILHPVWGETFRYGGIFDLAT